MSIVNNLFKKERENNGVIGMDKRISGITAFGPGYVNKDLELIVGLQTEKPLERAYMPMGGIRTAIAAAQSYGIETDKNNDEIFLKYRKTHNQGVFDAYTDDMRKARHTHIITGLPDAYARGRIIGDYRRIALYGIDFLIQQKKNDLKKMIGAMSNSLIQLREEVSEQIRALISIKEMAASYGYDISSPAINAHEAIQ
jgi:formate C-acetyltransferase